jgi:hypothetical protein
MPADGPSTLINACRLWERTSAKGNRYLTGRLGGLKVLIMENTRPAEGDDSTHTLFFGEAAQKPRDAPQRVEGRQTTEGRQTIPEGSQPRGKVQMPVGDKVPF